MIRRKERKEKIFVKKKRPKEKYEKSVGHFIVFSTVRM